MRFFFLAKEKKNVSLNTTSSSRFLFCSLSVSLSLSLSAQTVKVIFEGRRETAFLPLFFCSRRRLFRAAASSRVSALSLFFRCLSARVSFKRK
jgi:hypothetical protein